MDLIRRVRVLALAILLLSGSSPGLSQFSDNPGCCDNPAIAPNTCNNCDACSNCDDLCSCAEQSPTSHLDHTMESLFPKAASIFDWDVLYTNDMFRNTRGGIETGGVATGLVDVVLRTDLEALGLKTLGGTLVLHGQNNHGPSLQSRVGATQSTNIDAEPFTAMAEYYWERQLLDDNAVIRIGRQVGANQFSVLDPAADFLYGGFIISPNNPLPWYPNPTVAITGNVKLTDQFDLGAGVFNGGPADQLSPWGWSEDGRCYSVLELTYAYDLGGLPGDIQNGFWYSSGNHVDTAGGATHDGNYGYYLGIDQMLIAEQCASDQGLATFFIYSWAPNDRNNIEHHGAGGLVYRGLLPCRDGDVTGIGVSTVDFSNPVAAPDSETVVEAFHKLLFHNSILVQPAIQYIDSPSGIRPDALVAGVRIGFEL